jgi:hypothetical protein
MNSLLGTARHLLLFACGVGLSTAHGLAGTSRGPLKHEGEDAFAIVSAGIDAARALEARLRKIRVVVHAGGSDFLPAAPRGEERPGGEREPAARTTPALSVEVRAGADAFAVGLVVMDDVGMGGFESSPGLQVGIGPCLFLLDAGTDRGTARFNVYGFLVGQGGLVGGIGLQGTRTTRGSAGWRS